MSLTRDVLPPTSFLPAPRTRMRRVALTIGLAAAATLAHANEEQARNAAVADGVSTAIGLARHASELNPFGPILALGIKPVALHYAQGLPDTERPGAYAVAAAVWGGAAANNLCVTAALLSGGTFAPVCVAVGVAWALKTWKDSEHERRFWEGCALLRQYSGQPELACIYTPPPAPMVLEAKRDPGGPVSLAMP